MALRYMYASGLFQAYLLLRYASGLFQAYLLFLSLFSPFIPKLLKDAIFRPKNIFTRLLLPPQKLAALGGRLVRLVVKPPLRRGRQKRRQESRERQIPERHSDRQKEADDRTR